MSDQRSLSLDLGIPQVPEISGIDPMMFFEFQRIYNAMNNLAAALDSYTGRSPQLTAAQSGFDVSKTTRSQYLDVIYVRATVDTPAGAAVYSRWNATTEEYDGYLASAAAADTFCTGFCVTSAGVTAGSVFAMQLGVGLVPYIGSLLEGTVYYLSNTPGVITNAPGTYAQKLGYALAPTYFYFLPNCP